MAIPLLSDHLPSLVQFTRGLAEEHRHGSLTTGAIFVERVLQFYDARMMDTIEGVVPGWKKMASYANQQTLKHVTSVLTALHMLPEYQAASDHQQALMQWMVLFHDVAKEVQPGKHDYIHAFRSAAIAGKALAGVGFAVTDSYPHRIAEWVDLTYNAVRYDQASGETIQDNQYLQQIISGISDLYGAMSPARLVIGGVLLHLSLVTDPDYPILAPLSDTEIRRYINADLYRMLKVMMLVDTDGWNLFDPSEKLRQRQQTLAAFDRIAELIQLPKA